MKYKIVTKRNYESEQIEAESPENAIIQFATSMNTDMNLYFEAHQDLELDQYVGKKVEIYDKEKLFMKLNVKDVFCGTDLYGYTDKGSETSVNIYKYNFIIKAVDW